MPLIAIDRFQRGGSGTGPFAVVWEGDSKLSYATVADVTERDALPEWRRLPFMRVHVISTNTDYRLGVDVTIAGQSWTVVNDGVSPGTYQVTSEKNQPDGYVGLESNGKINPFYIDNIYVNGSFVVADNTARNALTTKTGDIVTVTSTSKIWVKLNNNAPVNVDADFAELSFPGSVLSVNGLTGAVTITIATLLAVPANVTSFNNQVAIAPSVTGLAGQIATNTTNIATLQSQVAGILADTSVSIPIWNNAVNYIVGNYVYKIDVDDNLILYMALSNNNNLDPESNPLTWKPIAGGAGGGGSSSLLFGNGLAESSGIVTLGGNLIQATVFTDTRVTKVGLQYAADYSADFALHSLVTRKFVEDAVAAVGSGITGLTAGRITFAASASTIIDSAALIWDTVNFRLSVGGAASPTARLHVRGVGSTTDELVKFETSGGVARFTMLDNGNATITGIWTVPTASFGTSTTQIATTAFVVNQLNTVVTNAAATGSISVDLSTGTTFIFTLTGNITNFTFTNEVVGKEYTFVFIQETTNRTISWASGKFSAPFNNLPVLHTSLNAGTPNYAIDIVSAKCYKTGKLALGHVSNLVEN
jgi:hypothetical protein